MAITAFSQWSTTASANVDLNNIELDSSTMLASEVDDAFREMMAQLKSGVQPLGTENYTTPTVTAGTGSFGAVSCILRYRKDGNRVDWTAYVQSVNKGTAAGALVIPLPHTPAASSASSPAYYPVYGRDNVGSHALSGYIAGGVAYAYVMKYDGTTAIGTSTGAVVGGVYFV